MLCSLSTLNLQILKEVVENHTGHCVNLQQFVACVKLIVGKRADAPRTQAELVELFSRINVKG